MATVESKPAQSNSNTELLACRKQVIERLSALRRNLRWQLVLNGLVLLATAVLAGFVVTLLLDYFLRLERVTRLAFSAMVVAGLVYVLYQYLIKPLRVDLEDLDLAELLDRRLPGVGQQMANVLQLPGLVEADQLASPSLVRKAVLDQMARLQTTDLSAAIDSQRSRRRKLMLAAVIAAGIAIVAIFPRISWFWSQRWLLDNNLRWPQHTYLSLVGLGERNSMLVPRGESVLLQIDSAPKFAAAKDGWNLTGRGETLLVPGREPPHSELPGRINVTALGESGERTQASFVHFSGSNYRCELPPIRERTTLQITGGDDWFGPVTLEPVDRPRIDHLLLAAATPGGGKAQVIPVGKSDQPLLFLPHTQLVMYLGSDQPLSSIDLTTLPASAVKLDRQDARWWRLRWEMKDPISLEMQLNSRDTGLGSKPYPLSIGLLQDRDPRTTLRITGVGRRVTPQARIPLSIRATDDFGLASVDGDLEVTVQENEKAVVTPHPFTVAKIPAAAGSPSLELEKEHTLELRPLTLEPGTILRVRASATDRSLLGAKTGYSRWLPLQVVKEDELLYEILMRQREQRARFTQLLNSAKGQATALTNVASNEDVATISRNHQLISRGVWRVTAQLDATLLELTLNDLSTEQARTLLAKQIIQPLRQLYDVQLPSLKSALDTLAADDVPVRAKREAAAKSQDEVVASMQKILDQMGQWESFVDVVNQLRQVISLQKQMLDETEKMKKKRTDEIFDK